jgi:hypothetical protein
VTTWWLTSRGIRDVSVTEFMRKCWRFLAWGYPQFIWIFHYKASILGYPHDYGTPLWKLVTTAKVGSRRRRQGWRKNFRSFEHLHFIYFSEQTQIFHGSYPLYN